MISVLIELEGAACRRQSSIQVLLLLRFLLETSLDLLQRLTLLILNRHLFVHNSRVTRSMTIIDRYFARGLIRINAICRFRKEPRRKHLHARARHLSNESLANSGHTVRTCLTG